MADNTRNDPYIYTMRAVGRAKQDINIAWLSNQSRDHFAKISNEITNVITASLVLDEVKININSRIIEFKNPHGALVTLYIPSKISALTPRLLHGAILDVWHGYGDVVSTDNISDFFATYFAEPIAYNPRLMVVAVLPDYLEA